MVLKTASLPDQLRKVILNKGTEYPFTGQYDSLDTPGTYLCRQCGLALFRAQTKFPSGCGWPSFDAEIPGTVEKKPDADGRRTEILCARCGAHLGHVFSGEGYTAKNTRHCVNSASLDFVANSKVLDSEEAIFAGGCFWVVEYLLQQLPGVLKTEVGYTGGIKANPTYEEVCNGDTEHYEAIRVLYDPNELSYEQLTKFFFEIHDPTQISGQGPDIGKQYRSAIFYYEDEQRQQAQKLMTELESKGMNIATKLLPVTIFWSAEKYHQDYYKKNGKQPYCHHYIKKF